MVTKLFLILVLCFLKFFSFPQLSAMEPGLTIEELSKKLNILKGSMGSLQDKLKGFSGQLGLLANTLNKDFSTDAGHDVHATGNETLVFLGTEDLSQEKIQRIIDQHSTTIKFLHVDDCKKIKKLNLTKCIKLEELWAEGCSEIESLDLFNCVALKIIDVSNCTKLKSLALIPNGKNQYEALYVGNTQLHNDNDFCQNILNIIKSKKITALDFEGFSNFTKLDLRNNESLYYLNLGQCVNLETLILVAGVNFQTLCLPGTKLNKESVEKLQPIIAQSTNLKYLDLRNVKHIEVLDLRKCTQLETLRVNNNVNLRELHLRTVTIGMLDFRTLNNLEILTLDDVKVTNLYLSGTKLNKESMEKLQIEISKNDSLVELDLSGLGELELLDLRLCNQLEKLYLQDCTGLKGIRFDDKKTLPLKVANLSNCSQLNTIQSYKGVAASWIPFLGKHFTGTPMEYLISQLPKSLGLLWVQGSSIKELNLEDFFNLEDLNCDNCDQLASVKFPINGSLKKLSLLNSAIQVLHIEKLFKLKNLSLGGCYNLTKVNLPENSLLEILDLKNCKKLTDAYLKEILVRSQNLLNLDLAFSNVGAIDLENNKALNHLCFEGCKKLTTVKNLSECSLLETLSFKDCIALNKIGNSLSWAMGNGESTLNSTILPNLPSSLKSLDLTGCVNAKKGIVTNKLPSCKIIG